MEETPAHLGPGSLCGRGVGCTEGRGPWREETGVRPPGTRKAPALGGRFPGQAVLYPGLQVSGAIMGTQPHSRVRSGLRQRPAWGAPTLHPLPLPEVGRVVPAPARLTVSWGH